MRKIYIVTKLFNINDRLSSIELCNTIDQWVEQGEFGDNLDKCFLPYRDSNERVRNKQNKTLEIFKMDCNTIANSALLIGFFDGPVYDSGIAFELGFAYTMGIPIILLTTDYFYKLNKREVVSINKLVNDISQIIHVRESNVRINSYQDTLLNIKRQVYYEMKIHIKAALDHEKKSQNSISSKRKDIDLFIDINFFRYESIRNEMLKYVQKLRLKNKVIYIPTENEFSDISQIVDLLGRSKKVCIYGEGFDMNIDSAILQGIAYGMNIEIWLYYSYKEALFQSEDFILERNPMITHSASKCLNTLYEIVENI